MTGTIMVGNDTEFNSSHELQPSKPFIFMLFKKFSVSLN